MVELQRTVRGVHCPSCKGYNCECKSNKVLDNNYRDAEFGAQLQEEIWYCPNCKAFFVIQSEYRMMNYVYMIDGEPGDTIYDIAEE